MSILILDYILAGALILACVWILTIERRLRRFFTGTKAKNLEGIMADISKQLGEVKHTQGEINKHLRTVDKRLDRSIRNIETVRFNPFEDAGSNQSFAMESSSRACMPVIA
jgi:hypothetical protein